MKKEVYSNFSKYYGKVVVVTSPSHLKNYIFHSTYTEIKVELFTFSLDSLAYLLL